MRIYKAESIVVCLIVAMLSLLIWSVYYENTVEMPAAYAAWVKQTGNEKHMTYDEWASLTRAQRKTEMVPIPIIIMQP